MEILLTGANGFLGKIINNKLQKEHQFITLSRNSGEYMVCLDSEVPIFRETYDLVIHAAGKAHSIPKTESERKQFYDVNVIGTQNLLKGLEKSGVPNQFVFISSVSVYGQECGKEIKEDHELQAKDAYGLSKIKAEELVVEWCKTNNVICTILRLPLLVGPKPPGNLGAMVKAINKGYYFNVGGGFAKKSMVLTADVAKIIPFASLIGGVFNLTDGNHPNFRELSLSISKCNNKMRPLNLPIYLTKIMGKVGDLFGDKAPINSMKVKKITSDLTFDDGKARSILGWKPQSVVEYLKNNKL